MKKTITALLLTAALFSGCGEKEKPVEIFTFDVEVFRMDYIAPDGSSWDVAPSNPFPDVYAVFRRKGSTNQQTTFTSQNQSTLPFFLLGSFSDRPAGHVYELLFFDDDSNDLFSGSDDFMGGYEFTVNTALRPETILLDDLFQKVGARIHLTYQ